MTSPEPTGGDERIAVVPFLMVMTVVTGIVDAVSILRLGDVFVANMTGNMVFLGFAVGGASEFSVPASLTALAAFLVGAALGGRVVAPTALHAVRRIATIEATLFAAATILVMVSSSSSDTGLRYATIAVLAVAMGGQNATARKLAVPDMTTTVLTLTITGLAADRKDTGSFGSRTVRRIGAVAAMLCGAITGALLVLHAAAALALAAATALLAGVALSVPRSAR
jgi:uncharacterized membrane protein YoaK (UPF0700 family)